MSTPGSQQSAGLLAAMSPVSAGRIKPDGRRVYRLIPPQVLWWLWVALAGLSLGDLLVQGHRGIPPRYLAGALAITGVVFVCTVWPRVIADDDGLTVRNPLRSFRIPWGACHGFSLGDSVEVHCARTPPKTDKTVYSWALSSPRRARARAELHRGFLGRGLASSRSAGYNRLPKEAREALSQGHAALMARELTGISDRARERGDLPPAAGAVLSARWDWQPLAAILISALAFSLLLI